MQWNMYSWSNLDLWAWATINNYGDNYFEAIKAFGVLRWKLLRNDDVLASGPSFVHTKTTGAVAEHRKVKTLRIPSMANSFTKDAANTAEAYHLKKHRIVRVPEVLTRRASDVANENELSKVPAATAIATKVTSQAPWTYSSNESHKFRKDGQTQPWRSARNQVGVRFWSVNQGTLLPESPEKPRTNGHPHRRRGFPIGLRLWHISRAEYLRSIIRSSSPDCGDMGKAPSRSDEAQHFSNILIRSTSSRSSHLESWHVIRKIHESTGMWFFQVFMKEQAAAVLNSKIAIRLKSSRKCQEKGTLTAYYKVVNYLLETYATGYWLFDRRNGRGNHEVH